MNKRVVRHDYDHYSNFGFYVGYPWTWYYGYGYGGRYSSYGYYGYHSWGFHWPSPVTVAYVPYGFYSSRPAVWVREVRVVEEVPVIVREEVPVIIREGTAGGGAVVRTSEWEEEPAAPEVLEPEPEGEGPPSFDATTERYLRDGSGAFAKADYKAAAEYFRMAVLGNPDRAAPKFAFGQALLAVGDYPYASRVLREAIAQDPEVMNAPGSIAGVYKDAEEFGRVLSALKSAVLEHRNDPDLLFLLLYEQYFTGDAQSAVTLEKLTEAYPEDPAVGLFGPAIGERFPQLAKFPPSKK